LLIFECNCLSFNEAVSKQSSNQTFHSFCLYNTQPVEKAGEEEKKENETKSFVGTTKNQSQQKSFLVLLFSPNPLSLSLSLNEKFSSLVVLFCSRRNIFSLRSIDEKSFSYRLRTSSPKT
jgi:hypothetical protein